MKTFSKRGASRLALLAGVLVVGAVLAVAAGWLPREAGAAPPVVVYKTATCGCCGAWVSHLQAAGFVTHVHDVEDLAAVKARLGVPQGLGSCHTATVGGYVIEGHVPAADVARLLKQRPAGQGLAVPGMPVGSPGMEHGDRLDPYEVLLWGEGGEAQVFAEYGGAAP
ncbi:MAG: DUF411 domain-containing protein [Pseudomonadota bacterium]